MPVWSEQERMIAQSVADFFKGQGGTDRIRRLRDHRRRDRATWQDVADQGWIGTLISESAGGLGLELRDGLVLMREASRSVASEPLAGAIAAAQALVALPACRGIMLEAISGKRIVLPAWARVTRRQGTLCCDSAPLPGLGAADTILLFDGASNSVILVNREQPGVEVETAATLDGGDIGRLLLKDVAAETVASGGSARTLSLDTRDVGFMLHAAELCGLGDEVLRRTLAHLEGRRQFGVALASFQAIQQRMASVYVQIAAADALLFEAARAFEGPRQSFAAGAAFLRAGQAAHLACREAIQFHGAIGFTDELDIGFYLKRCMAITAAHGGLEAVRSGITH